MTTSCGTTSVTDFGADPAGQRDASPGIQDAIASLSTGGGTFANGVVIGSDQPNTEYMSFRRCQITFVEDACVDIASSNPNAKSHGFHECVFGQSRYGIRLNSGSFQAYSCAFSYLDTV